MLEMAEAAVRDLAEFRADWRVRPCCCPLPASPTWSDRVNVFASLCRRIETYRQKVVLEQLDDHLLDDIGIDNWIFRRMTIQERRAYRRICRVACGGFY
jgi:DNA-directed RNA polymerase subunit N (RpoN/RPB10)